MNDLDRGAISVWQVVTLYILKTKERLGRVSVCVWGGGGRKGGSGAGLP